MVHLNSLFTEGMAFVYDSYGPSFIYLIIISSMIIGKMCNGTCIINGIVFIGFYIDAQPVVGAYGITYAQSLQVKTRLCSGIVRRNFPLLTEYGVLTPHPILTTFRPAIGGSLILSKVDMTVFSVA